MQVIPEELIERARDGDLQAFHEVYQLSSGFVFSLAMRMAQNTADAEEITQDVYVKVYKNLKQYEGRSAFNTWLYRITMNTALNFCKKRSAEFQKQQQMEAVGGMPTIQEPDAGKDFSKQKADEKLKEILSHLNEDQRACILLREIEGLNYQEIADVLKVKMNTVRTRIKRAREAMVKFVRQGGVCHEL